MRAIHPSIAPFGLSALSRARRASIVVLYPWVSYVGLGVRLYVIPYILYFPSVHGLPKLVLLVSDNGKVTSDHSWIIYGLIPKLAYEFVFRCLVVL